VSEDFFLPASALFGVVYSPTPMESSSPLSIIVEVPGFVRVYDDGTVKRLVDLGTVPPSSELGDEFKEGVASKDVVIDPQTGVFVRLYLPRLEVTDGKGRVPLLVYVHGGGFCIESTASPIYHSYLNKVATEAKVICVSVEYRRSPEHRLPAAYDDCIGVLEWLHRQAMALEGVSVDPWLALHADFSKVFLVGDSAGGNIVHQVGILASGRNWDGLCFQGAILVHPFFDGEERIGRELGTGTEVESFNKLKDSIWSISLPAGADKDHPFSNPVGPGSPPLSDLVYGRILVFVAEQDLLRERGILYYEALKKAGKDVDLVITEGEGHVFHLFNPKSENASFMLKSISDFMHFSSDHSNNSRNLSV
jgi:acetyl esterase/lipase